MWACDPADASSGPPAQRSVFPEVATVTPEGSPEATVVWTDSDSEHIYSNTALHRLNARNLLRNPRIAITVIDSQNAYRDALAIRGRAELST